MSIYDKLFKMDSIFGIWNYTDRLRITYVSQGWLIVWDHQQVPPTRYDCQRTTHQEACLSVMDKIREIVTN